jgi:ribosomal peptide maturation radical SAM protein 1
MRHMGTVARNGTSIMSATEKMVTLVTLEPQDASNAESASNGFRVALVCMPFGSVMTPSIQLGLLAAIAMRAGFKTDTHYFNLDLAAELTPQIYEELCEQRQHMTGEWLFACAAFGADSPSDEDAYLKAFPEDVKWVESFGKDISFVVELRREILPAYIERCVAAVDWAKYRVVGFSSTFQQNVACLALARLIKERFPHVTIVFGGANMDGDMGPEYVRSFPFIDYGVVGEGDIVFPSLLRKLARKEPTGGIGGLVANTPKGFVSNGDGASPLRELDALPVPNYDFYFERAIALGLLPYYQGLWSIPFESSRGCWWGEKHHCTFCGLNGNGLVYRSKTPQRLLNELSALAISHRITSFTAVDNILDWKYLPEVFTKLDQTKTDYEFFYEIKANLTRQQIQTLYRGGVRRIQPGVESLSSHVLQLMRKGCTMLINLRCLKWCLYYNIHVSWNLIWGFPGETEVDYEEQLEVLKCITHLQPPIGAGPLWLERFSPYYTERQSFPVRNIRPESSYGFVYPKHVNLDNAAYFFEYEMGDTIPATVHLPTKCHVEEWQASWRSDLRPTLTYRRISDGLLIDYNWGPQQKGTYTILGVLGLIYEFCVETFHTAVQVAEYLNNIDLSDNTSIDEVRDVLDEFCRGRLMVTEDGKYFSLALPVNPNW